MNVIERIRQVGLVGERRALSLLLLGFYTALFGLMGVLLAQQLPEWAPAFLGLAACYAIGFFALAAGWFWGRWYALGLGYSGLTMAAMVLVTSPEAREMALETMLFYGATHGVIWLALLGDKMAAAYEAQEEWRKRFGLDEQGVHRVRQAVTRAATSLPSLIVWALAPRQPAESLGWLLAIVGLGLAGSGLWALVRARSWGVFALGAAAATVAIAAVTGAVASPTGPLWLPMPASVDSLFGVGLPVVAAIALASAVAPFARPIAGWLQRRA